MSHGREGGAAEDVHSHGARQVAGLPATAVLEVQVVEGLQVFWVRLQAHLAQEFVLQNSVIPDLRGEVGEGCVQDQRRSLRQVGCEDRA